MLPKELIEEIRLGTDLVKLIGETVSLKRSGTNYVGRCPFHEEKSPSFSVSPSKQLYHCFGCGEGGTAITFVMKFFHLPFIDAVERLAQRLSIDLAQYQQKDSSEIHKRKNVLWVVLSYAMQKYSSVLSTKFGKEAMEYLTSTRGLTQKTVQDFSLGFAPDGWDHMVNAIERDKLSIDAAVKVGLIAKRQKGTGFYDVFRNRIIVPIQDVQGHVIGFGGRAMASEQPKYLNSPQSDVFDKSRLLFGLPQAERSIREKGFVLIVEGYFDLMMLHQNGFTNTVATLGTSLTEQHAELLKRYTEKVVVVFDGDKAGLTASKRSMQPLLTRGFETRCVRIPGNIDPDAYLRKFGAQSFQELMDQAPMLFDIMIDVFFHQEKTLGKKAEFLEELSLIIKNTKNVFFQEVLTHEFSVKTGIEKKNLMAPSKPKPAFLGKVASKEGSGSIQSELILIRLYVEARDFRDQIRRDVEDFFVDHFLRQISLEWMDQVDQSDSIQVGSATQMWPDDATRAAFIKVCMEPWKEEKSFQQKILEDAEANLKKKKRKYATQSILSDDLLKKAEEEIAGRIHEVYKQ